MIYQWKNTSFLALETKGRKVFENQPAFVLQVLSDSTLLQIVLARDHRPVCALHLGRLNILPNWHV